MEQASLFPRKAQRQRAGLNADPDVMQKYERTLITFGQVKGSFVAADVTEFYQSKYGPLSQTDAKGLGSLYADLQLRGVIRKNGLVMPRKNGNLAAAYELVK